MTFSHVTIGISDIDRALGATDDGAPGLRPHCHPNHDAASVRDPDGNKLCSVCHAAEGRAATR